VSNVFDSLIAAGNSFQIIGAEQLKERLLKLVVQKGIEEIMTGWAETTRWLSHVKKISDVWWLERPGVEMDVSTFDKETVYVRLMGIVAHRTELFAEMTPEPIAPSWLFDGVNLRRLSKRCRSSPLDSGTRKRRSCCTSVYAVEGHTVWRPSRPICVRQLGHAGRGRGVCRPNRRPCNVLGICLQF